MKRIIIINPLIAAILAGCAGSGSGADTNDDTPTNSAPTAANVSISNENAGGTDVRDTLTGTAEGFISIVVNLGCPAPATLVIDRSASGTTCRLLELAALLVGVVNLLPQQSVASLRWSSGRACLHYSVLGIDE